MISHEKNKLSKSSKHHTCYDKWFGLHNVDTHLESSVLM